MYTFYKSLKWQNWNNALFACLLFILIAGEMPLFADNFQSVLPGALRNNPKLYWSTGIIYKDVLIDHPHGKTLKIGTEEFLPFTTKELGVCYADMHLADTLYTLPLNREYLFRGTVLNRRNSFYVIARSAAASFETRDNENAAILDTLSTDPAQAKGDDTFNALLAEAYSAYFSYAEDIEIDVQVLFNQDSRHQDKLLSLIGDATRTVEKEQQTTAAAILNRLVRDILATRYGNTDNALPETRSIQEPRAPVEPVITETPEFDSSIFILKPGVGKRPIAPAPDGELKQEVLVFPKELKTEPVAEDKTKKVEKKTRKRAISLWSKRKQTEKSNKKNKPAPKPKIENVKQAPTDDLNRAIGW